MDIIKLAKVNKLIKTASSGGSRQATGFVSPAAQKQARLTTKIPVDSGLHGAALETTNIKYDQVAIDSIFKQLTANKVSNVSITDKGNGQSTITFVYNDHSTFSADVPTPAGQLVQDFYKLGTSNTEPPGADGWATVLGTDLTPTADKPYLWNAEVTYMSYEKVPTKPEVDDNKKVKNAAVIANYSSSGANGASIIGVVNYYIASESQADPGDVWGTAESTPDNYSVTTPYLYGRERVYYDKQVSGSVLDNSEGTYKGKYYTFTEWHLNSKWGDKGDKGDKGAKGDKGDKGDPGKSGTAVKEFYALGGKDGAVPSSGWQDSLTGLKISESSPYLWNYEAIYIAGQTEPSTPTEAPKTNVAIIANWSKDGANGANGASVTGVAEQYYATTTESANLGNTDGYSTPSEAGYSATKCYLWNRERVYLDGTAQNWTSWVLISKWGDKGDKGDKGAKGDKGDKGENAKTIQEYYTILSESATSDELGAVADTDWVTSINKLGTMTSGQAIWNCEVPYTMGNTPSITQDAKKNATIIARYADGISSITEMYLVTTASTGVTTDTTKWNWQDSIPTITEKAPYLWNYTITSYTGGKPATHTDPAVIGHYGANGKSGTAVKEFYALGGAGGEIPSSGWKDSLTGLTISEDHPYLWNYEAIYTAGQTEPSVPEGGPTNNVAIIARYAKDGTNGTNGKNGASVTKIEEQYYATTAEDADLSGKSGSTTPSDAGYNATNCYLWNREQVYLDDNPKGWTSWVLISKWGDKGDKGDKGDNADTIQEFYGLSNDETALPTTWATSLGANTQVSSTNRFLWNHEETYTVGKEPPTKPANATLNNSSIIARYTKDGVGILSIKEKYLATTASTGVTTSSGDWGIWQDDVPTIGSSKPYLWNYSITTYTDSTTTSTAPAVIGHYGANGKNADTIQEFYTILPESANADVLHSANWVTSINELGIMTSGQAIWNCEVPYTMGGKPDLTNDIKEKATIIARYAEDGTNGASIIGVVNYYGASVSDREDPSDPWGTAEATPNDYSATTPYLYGRERVYYDKQVADSTPETEGKYKGKYYTSTEWHLVSKWGDKGDKGDNGSTIQEFYGLSNDETTRPTKWETSLGANTQVSPTNRFLWNCEQSYTVGTNPPTEPSSTAASNSSIIARYTKDGIGISSIKEIYLATDAGAGVTDKTPGWQESIPTIDSSKPYLWNYTTTVYTDGSSTSTQPVIIGHYGDGVPSLTAVSSLSSTAYLFLSGKLIYKTSETGHTRILFNPSTQQIDSVSNFADATTAGLMHSAGALTGINPNEIVILLSCGGCSLSSDERSSLNNDLGGYLTDTWGTDASAKAHAFIGMAGLTPGNAYESVFSDADTSATSYEDFNTSDSGVLYDGKGDVFQVIADRDTRITCYFSDTGIVLNGAQGDTPIPKVDDNGDLSFISKFTGKNIVEKIGLVPKIDGNNWVLGTNSKNLGAARYVPHFSSDGILSWNDKGSADSYNLKPTVTLERNSTGANLTIKIGDSATATTTLNDGKANLTLPAPVDNGEYFLDFVYDPAALENETNYAMGIFSSSFTGDDATAESFHTDNDGNRLKGYAFGSSAHIQVCGSASEARIVLEQAGYPASIWITDTKIQLFLGEDGFYSIKNGELAPFTDADGGVTIVWP